MYSVCVLRAVSRHSTLPPSTCASGGGYSTSISATGSYLRGQSGHGEGGSGRLCRKTLKPNRSFRSDSSVFFVGEPHARKILPSRDQARKSVTAAGFVLDGATGGPLMPQPEKASGRSRRIDKMAGFLCVKGRS